MENIVIIGAGELGSRHLQALALHEKELNIYVIDPVKDALDRSNVRFTEVDKYKNKVLYYMDSIQGLPSMIDFAVISTTSLQRFVAMKSLLEVSKVRYLILEKFLFPKFHEYVEAEELIKRKNVKTYVNCTRRVFPIYQEIKNAISEDKYIRLTVTGSKWNMGSNSIHFLDLLGYLTSSNNFTILTNKLDMELLMNKRCGYIEFSGSLSAYDARGNEMYLTSDAIGNRPINILIETNKNKFIIDEYNKEISYFKDGFIHKESFELYRQSELTHRIFEQLVKNGNCGLVEFQESVHYHLTLLDAFNEFLGQREGVIT